MPSDFQLRGARVEDQCVEPCRRYKIRPARAQRLAHTSARPTAVRGAVADRVSAGNRTSRV